MMATKLINGRVLMVVAVIAALPLLAGSGPAAQSTHRSPAIHSADKVADSNSDSAAESTNAGQIQGFTEPYADISLAASEMGTLAEVTVQDGDQVQVGQLLAKLDDAVLRASLAVARAGMSAEGELRSVQTQLDLKKVELEKLTELFERNHASQKELDRITGEVRIAETKVQSVREDLEVRRLEYARIEAQLEQRQIRSTIDGVVVDVRKDRGEFVSPSDPVVARIVQLNPLMVVFSVPTDRRGHVARGQTVAMQIGSDKAQGVVEHVSPTADASSQSFRVKVRLPNPDHRWHGGEKSILQLDSSTPSFVPEKLAKHTK